MGSLLKDTPHPQVIPRARPARFPSHQQPLTSHPPSAPTNLQTLDISREWNHTLCGLAFPRASVSRRVSAHHSPALLSKTPRRGQTTLYLHLRRLAGARAGLWALRAVTDDAPGNTRGRLGPGGTVAPGLTLCCGARLLAKAAGPAGQAPSHRRGLRAPHRLADISSCSSES